MTTRITSSTIYLGAPVARRGRPAAVSARGPGSILDALLFGLFVYDGFSLPGLPVAVPVSELAAVSLVLISLLRRQDRNLVPPRWLLGVFVVLLLFLAISSVVNDVDWYKRFVRILNLALLLWAISSGRINLKSGLSGIAIALSLNAVLFYVGMAPDNYVGKLTGYLGDKNVAGLYYTIFPILIAASSSNRRVRFLSLSAGLLATFLTESRTSLGAYAAALAWILVSSKLPRLARAAAGVLLILGLQFLETNLSRVWIFSDREGSDSLRERIGQAAVEKTDAAPWYGLGLGQANVNIEGRLWFFHDSYLGLIAEGGVAFFVVVVGLYVFNGLRPLTGGFRSTETIYVEAGTIALLVCAWKLGEVFLSIPGFVLLGYAVMLSAGVRAHKRGEVLVGR